MREFRERNKWKRILYSRWSLIALIILSFFMGNVVLNAYTRERLSAENSKRFEAQLQDIENRRVTLQADIAALQTPEGIEREIREKFNVVKGEEEIFVLVVDDSLSEQSSATTTTSWWQRILDLITF